MTIPIKMPQLGESVVEGTISRWLKVPGEPVAEYEPLLEVVSDKVDTEIPSPASGTLQEILVPAGETVAVGAVLAYLGDESAVDTADESHQADAKSVQADSMFRAAPKVSHAGTSGGRIVVSPAVSRMVAEHGIDLEELRAIEGLGQGGRVRKRDLDQYLQGRSTRTQRPPEPTTNLTGEPAPSESPFRAPEGTQTGRAPEPEIVGQTIPLTPMRAAIAEHMVRSTQTSAHVTSVLEVDMSRIVAFRQAHREAFARQGLSLTYTAFFVQASVEALKRYPIANASMVGNQIVIHPHINIGVAVALDNGLIVPVVKRAEELSLAGLAAAINDLATRARDKKLKRDDVQEGTFTVTNPGMSGVLFGTAIINQPQAAILGVGAITERPVVVNHAIAIRPMVYLALTYDHRIMDGAGANDVLIAIRDFLQSHPAG